MALSELACHSVGWSAIS